MSIEGFEEEILYLLRRMKGRIDQKGQDGESRIDQSLKQGFHLYISKSLVFSHTLLSLFIYFLACLAFGTCIIKDSTHA